MAKQPKQIKLATFIKRHGLTMTVKHLGQETETSGQFRDTKDKWRCIISRPGFKGKFVTPFSCGSGHNGKAPELPDVLDCMASDSATVENARGFEDWAGELGYETDSRAHEKIYKAVQRQRDKLKAFLGDEYETLLWHVERE